MNIEAASIFWFRRDLRLDDNIGLNKALQNQSSVQCIFIFDENILNDLEEDDARVQFIYDHLNTIHSKLKEHGSSLLVIKGKPFEVWKELAQNNAIKDVYCNEDYEPYAINREKEVASILEKHSIQFHAFKDQVIYAKNEVVKDDGNPYTVFTPFKKKWLRAFEQDGLNEFEETDFTNLSKSNFEFPSLKSIGFNPSEIQVSSYNVEVADEYAQKRDFPALPATSRLGPHLRFGTVSVRNIIRGLKSTHEVFLSELIWREFFMQILYHFPHVVENNFRAKYDGIEWRNEEKEFKKWCEGQTGYPLVDAGMRELNQTGFMHNRVRMVTASFLCKHLLIDWRWGEAYFAKKLLDYELSANNGNWQWAAGTGCDAAPYFRVFNPTTQLKKFDPQLEYTKKWVPEFGSLNYVQPMVEHKFARVRAIEAYKFGLAKAQVSS